MSYPNLGECVELLRENGLLAREPNLSADAAAKRIYGLDCDSRFMRESHIFACKGAAFKADYLISAAEQGACAYLCEESLEAELEQACSELPALVTTNIRLAMAKLSPRAWDHPDNNIELFGITGTKGKTTAAYMLKQIFEAEPNGAPCGVMGSIDTFDGVDSFESVNTTPEAPDLWRHLANVRDSKLGRMVMEVSSHALKYNRVDELTLSVAGFLNIGRDHISAAEHPDFEDYFQSKLRIFEHTDCAVVNLDTDERKRVLGAASSCKQLITLSAAGNKSADYRASKIRPSEGSITFELTSPRGTRKFEIGMFGLFNVENALCAIAMAELAGIPDEQIQAGLATVRVPGRMELIRTPRKKVSALVDYAHNGLSFQRFFASVKEEFPGRKLIALFGSVGDKAQERRKDLPREASKWADVLIYTEDDPAHEDPVDICNEMAANTPEGQYFEVIVDRPTAIARAVELGLSAPKGAIICLLAKGADTYQHRGDSFEPMETDGTIFEREIARQLSELNES